MRYEQRWTRWLIGIALSGAIAVACGGDDGSSSGAHTKTGGSANAGGSTGDGGAETGGSSTGGKGSGTGGKGTGGKGSGGDNTGGTDLGGATGTGGEGPSGPPASGNALVNAGGQVKSAKYQMVFTLGQSSTVQTKVSSPSYSLRGGLSATTGN